jgi:hypothetical protein
MLAWGAHNIYREKSSRYNKSDEGIKVGDDTSSLEPCVCRRLLFRIIYRFRGELQLFVTLWQKAEVSHFRKQIIINDWLLAYCT